MSYYKSNILRTDNNEVSSAYSPSTNLLFSPSQRFNPLFNQSRLNNGLFDKDNQIHILKEQLNKKNEFIQRNHEKIFELKDKIKTLRGEKDKLEMKENNKLKANNFQAQTILSLQEQIKRLTDEINRKNKIIESNKNIKKEMNKLKNNIISAHEVNYEGKLTLLKEDNNNLKSEIMKLKKELMIKSNEIDEIKNKNKSLLNQISENEKK